MSVVRRYLTAFALVAAFPLATVGLAIAMTWVLDHASWLFVLVLLLLVVTIVAQLIE